MIKFHKTVTPPPKGFMKVYFFFFCNFFGVFRISTKFMLGARFRDKNVIFDFFGIKITYFMIFGYFVLNYVLIIGILRKSIHKKDYLLVFKKNRGMKSS